MSQQTIRVVTRRSRLALVQTEWVVAELKKHHPRLNISVHPMDSEGDLHLDAPLTKLGGGKGLFTKALEEQLLSGAADFAVHSLKDMPAALPEGLMIAAIPVRADPRDAFVSVDYPHWRDLPAGARVGTSSLRRQAQICRLRPDIKPVFLRGNVDTRLQKLAKKEYDAILLAVAGLLRLNRQADITAIFAEEDMLPAVGQGALAVECRTSDTALQELLQAIHDPKTAAEVAAERAFNARLGGNCQTPIAGLAHKIENNRLQLSGLVASPQGEKILRATAIMPIDQGAALGVAVAEQLLAQGAAELLR
jgi:hydroxymethylbilane synthase